MTGLPGTGVDSDRQWSGISLSGDTGPPTDSVRFSVTAPLALPTRLITAIAPDKKAGTIYSRIFSFSIMYATCFHSRRSILLSGLTHDSRRCGGTP
jgi:hypothetical protein